LAEAQQIGAVVVGGDYQGLAIVRSLGRHGVPVCVLDDEPSISRYSRYATRSVRVENARDEEATIAALTDAAERFGMHGWIVFPTRDETVAALARNRERLMETLRVATPGWDSVRYACDKRETYRLALELDIPIPRTWFPTGLHDLAEVDAFPAVVKPALKDHFVRTTGAKAWRADSRAELEDAYRRAERVVGVGAPIVQELVPGGPGSIFGYCAHFTRGRVVGRMVVRYGRQHPPDFGRSATWVETVDLADLDEPSRRFLDAIGYRGLVELEYKLDPRDGAYRLLDVNARTWGYHALGARLGVDFPYLLYQDELGATPTAAQAPGGYGWVRVVTDLPTVIPGLIHRRLSLRDYLHSMRHVRCESVFSAGDPLPSLAELALLPHLYLSRSWRPRRVSSEVEGG
jgi:predicted ATP-grasp superfamily ATP-dependent carboligase